LQIVAGDTGDNGMWMKLCRTEQQNINWKEYQQHTPPIHAIVQEQKTTVKSKP